MTFLPGKICVVTYHTIVWQDEFKHHVAGTLMLGELVPGDIVFMIYKSEHEIFVLSKIGICWVNVSHVEEVFV